MAGVVENLFDLPAERHALRAVLATAHDEELGGVPELSAHLDQLLDDENPAAEVPDDLAFTRQKRKQLREFGFVDAPDRGAGDGMALDLGERGEIDRDHLKEVVAAVLSIILTAEDGVYPLESRQDSSESD